MLGHRQMCVEKRTLIRAVHRELFDCLLPILWDELRLVLPFPMVTQAPLQHDDMLCHQAVAVHRTVPMHFGVESHQAMLPTCLPTVTLGSFTGLPTLKSA